MRSKLQLASGIAVAATFFSALGLTTGPGASAEETAPNILEASFDATFASDTSVDIEAEDAPPSSLAELAAAQPQPESLSREMQCLAGAIYFEARGEPLNGQLAVGRVIVERAASGRFPASYCGVVYQPSQFSFARGQRMPAIRYASREWAEALAIAQIANAGSWRSPAEGALFFHASHVSPGWRLKRLGRVGNHVFYR